MLTNMINTANSYDGVSRDLLSKLLSDEKNVQVGINRVKSFLSTEDSENVNEIIGDVIKASDSIVASQKSEGAVAHVRNLSSAASRLLKLIKHEADMETNQNFKVYFKVDL